jgi:hypothetical protein
MDGTEKYTGPPWQQGADPASRVGPQIATHLMAASLRVADRV